MIHYTAMDGAEAALERLCDPVAEVSAHYLIAGDGTLWQLVREDMRAWHAGAGSWQGRDDINSRSIGIELDNRGDHPFAEPQMAALEGLLAQLMQRWSIPRIGVIGHSDMAPARKYDPGPRFDWRRLAQQGMAVWPEVGEPGVGGAEAEAQVGSFARDAARFGYPDAGIEAAELLSAFRARFRPQASGPICDADRTVMSDLARRFGVDRSERSA